MARVCKLDKAGMHQPGPDQKTEEPPHLDALPNPPLVVPAPPAAVADVGATIGAAGEAAGRRAAGGGWQEVDGWQEVNQKG
jgi:hypothetical protein